MVVGIDPGPVVSAYVALEGTHLRGWGKEHNPALLELICSWAQVFLVFEGLQCYGKPVGSSTFETAIWLGRFIQAAEYAKLPWQTVRRSDVKRHLCGPKAKLKDKQVRAALIAKYGAPGSKHNPGPTYGLSGDCWSALALADYGQFILANS